MLKELHEWLHSKKQDRAPGVELLKFYKANATDIEVCTKYVNSFTATKLYNLLLAIYHKEVVPTTQPVQPNIIPTPPPTAKAADTIIRLIHERSQLFKETLKLRAQLKESVNLKSKGTIHLGNALDLMESQDRKGRNLPFSIVAVTYNETTKEGGEILFYPKAQIASIDKGNKIASGKRAKIISNKQPNHWANGTRNIRPYDTPDIRKISIWLILQFNEMEVTLGDIG